MVVRIFTLFLFFINLNFLNAQVVINEYSASNLKGYVDNYDKAEDWIELYNTSPIEVNLEDWYLSDNESKPNKWKFPKDVVIAGHGYLIVFASGRDEFKDGYLHSEFKLNQCEQEDFVILSKPDKTIVDKFKLPITQLGHSICRSIDGGSTWVYTSEATPNNDNSGSILFQFNSYAPKPELNVTAGYFDTTVVVRLKSTFPDDIHIRYTLDGYEPTNFSPKFPDSLEIKQTTVLKLKAFAEDTSVFPGFCEFNTYFIKEEFSLPVFSVAADKLTNLANGQKELRPIGSIEYFDLTEERKSTGYGELNSHGQDSWALNQRSLDWITRDEMGYAAAIYQPLFKLSEREEFQRFIFRASGDDNFPAINDGQHNGSVHLRDEYVHTLAQEGGMSLDVRTAERCIVFLNGEYWGVYAIRERPDDHDFTDYFYKQDKYDLQYLATWGGSWSEYGGDEAQQDWAEIRDFALNEDMSVDSNYALLNDNVDLISLADYMIINLNVVASDWLNYNTGWWRGLNEKGSHKKWGYTLWDLDATFDYYINYSGVPNISPTALPCDIEEISEYMDDFFDGNDLGLHEKILLKLLDESGTFRQLYYSRYADLMNTVFTCENMLETLDRMIAQIEPDMPRHIDRWGGTMNKWQNNLNRMKNFIEARCQNFDGNLIECYEPDNSYNLTVMTDPPEVAHITLNTLKHEQLPWSGRYYDNMEQLVQTVRTDDTYEFSHWSSAGSKILITDSLLTSTSITLSADDTLIAHYKNPVSSTDQSDFAGTRIYPNPTNGVINILISERNESSNVDCTIVDAAGRALYNQKLKLNPGQNKYSVSMEDLNISGGVYFVKLSSTLDLEYYKFIYIK